MHIILKVMDNERSHLKLTLGGEGPSKDFDFIFMPDTTFTWISPHLWSEWAKQVERLSYET